MAVVLIAAIAVVFNPNLSNSTEQKPETTQIIDMLERNVTVPIDVNRIVGVNPGCLRLLTYVGASDRVCGIEVFESDFTGRPYAMAQSWWMEKESAK